MVVRNSGGSPKQWRRIGADEICQAAEWCRTAATYECGTGEGIRKGDTSRRNWEAPQIQTHQRGGSGGAERLPLRQRATERNWHQSLRRLWLGVLQIVGADTSRCASLAKCSHLASRTGLAEAVCLITGGTLESEKSACCQFWRVFRQPPKPSITVVDFQPGCYSLTTDHNVKGQHVETRQWRGDNASWSPERSTYWRVSLQASSTVWTAIWAQRYHPQLLH